MIVVEGHNIRLTDDVARRCPFCGSGEIFVTARKPFDEIVAVHGRACLPIGCGNCGAEVIAFEDANGNDTEYDPMLEVAIAKWNRRSNA